jgi:hypothetical protein
MIVVDETIRGMDREIKVIGLISDTSQRESLSLGSGDPPRSDFRSLGTRDQYAGSVRTVDSLVDRPC